MAANKHACVYKHMLFVYNHRLAKPIRAYGKLSKTLSRIYQASFAIWLQTWRKNVLFVWVNTDNILTSNRSKLENRKTHDDEPR